MKLHELIALEKSVSTTNTKSITQLHHDNQKPAAFAGNHRSYVPMVEDEADQPVDSTRPTIRASFQMNEFSALWAEMVNLRFQKESSNTVATADVVIGKDTLATNVPVVVLIQLESKLNDVRAFIENIPILNPTYVWTWDENLEVWRSEVVETVRTRKVNRHKILVEPTKEHPAQIREWQEDIPVGRWKSVLYSTAIPVAQRRKLQSRAEDLISAVKMARERANAVEVLQVARLGSNLMDYVFE